MPAVSPVMLHQPGDTTRRPKGILKNPSFSADQPTSPVREVSVDLSVAPTISESADQKDLTLQNTLQNAGHRRSSSAARRASASRRQSQPGGMGTAGQEDSEHMRLKWDEANLYLAEQQKSSTMKITEPKTPFQHTKDLPPDEEDAEDVAIDPRFVDVDELDVQKRTGNRSGRESDIPGLELGDPEDSGVMDENDDGGRIVRDGSISREGSTASRGEKHVNVEEEETSVGMPTREEVEKHKKFEEARKKHYEMGNVKDMLGHPEEIDAMDEDEDDNKRRMPNLPSRGINGAR